ncbi:GALNT12 [Symbiodinium natans]|uniref:GALNT12 protein n=1 Tax=Symbiodinium natans TaxID=878477 RepID=A0A812J6T7_9DINO|nr:GALNT12 [Symbiodinium natans]
MRTHEPGMSSNATVAWFRAVHQQIMEDDSDRMWGDIFRDISKILWYIHAVWLAVILVVAVAVAVFHKDWLLEDGPDISEGPTEANMDALGSLRKHFQSLWASVERSCKILFASLNSHVTGIVSFVGFQKIVANRIVAASRPGIAGGGADDFLLCTCIAVSALGILTSLVFLGIDYMRRRVIDSAWQDELRLELASKRIDSTGLGRILIFLTGLLLLLYLVVIYQNCKEEAFHVDRWLVLRRICSCATVVLYLSNLNGLFESPKMPFKDMKDIPAQSIDVEAYLQKHGGDSALTSPFRRKLGELSGWLAGEDLGQFVQKGSRHALFPNEPRTAWVHVILGLLLVGVAPFAFQLAMSELFVTPAIVDLRPLSAMLIPKFHPGLKLHTYRLLVNPASSRLQVSPKFSQASSVSICCATGSSYPPCEKIPFDHSLLSFDERPAALQVPIASVSAQCELTVRGLSRDDTTRLHLTVETVNKYHFSDCVEDVCSCGRGFQGKPYNASDNASDGAGPNANTCTPAPCNITGSNEESGLKCRCSDGFRGNITWDGPDPQGTCLPAPCNVNNSNGKFGLECACADSYAGNITWSGTAATGNCEPAVCMVAHAVGNGNGCRCEDGFAGKIAWKGPDAQGSCTPAICNIANSNLELGHSCRCSSGFAGNITWKEDVSSGTCEPAECAVEHSNEKHGFACACTDGFIGNITWNGSTANGPCEPAPCNVANTSGKGPSCTCRDGFEGNITWHGAVADGSCRPASCSVNNSNMKSWPDCRCKTRGCQDALPTSSIQCGPALPQSAVAAVLLMRSCSKSRL